MIMRCALANVEYQKYSLNKTAIKQTKTKIKRTADTITIS